MRYPSWWIAQGLVSWSLKLPNNVRFKIAPWDLGSCFFFVWWFRCGMGLSYIFRIKLNICSESVFSHISLFFRLGNKSRTCWKSWAITPHWRIFPLYNCTYFVTFLLVVSFATYYRFNRRSEYFWHVYKIGVSGWMTGNDRKTKLRVDRNSRHKGNQNAIVRSPSPSRFRRVRKLEERFVLCV